MLLFLGACSLQAESPLIQAAPGWKVELIAEAPSILDPSVVCCSPDGRIFLGSDPVDMAAPSDSASDKILCIYPDGRIQTFATNLHAVFGLQYIDGKLYVHHTPKFSVFDDENGVGTHRRDLIASDNLHPWLPSFNDHIPSNCRLAMDGFLYITTGDKGVYGAVGTDGRKLEIHGGGIYRMRPDGTGLEIYCTGTRNHLDVAINSEDEMFTYDNTDDGVGWWTRVTHMVDGGYYGYPYEYKPQRPYTLWKMTDYGGGAPTGACAYNEDALPDEYHGDLFLCEWGRQQVLRLKVQREGATYKVVSRVQDNKLDFLTLGKARDFRPVGITVTPDGKGFYVADWGKGTWRHTDIIGRLYKVTYTGPTQEKPKPSWYVPAAMGLKFHASTRDLMAGLKHPAESVRLVSQRRLAERGHSAVRPLAALLKDRQAPAYARWSAIWTLDAIDGGQKERKTILRALDDPDATVQMQAARQLGTRRAVEAVPTLIKLLQNTNPAICLKAATALGRIGDAAAVPALLEALEQKDLFARYAAFYALRRIGLQNGQAWTAIVGGLASDRPAVREGTTFAVRETYDPALVQALAALVSKTSMAVDFKTNVLGLLRDLHQQRPAWDGEWWNTKPAEHAPPAKSKKWAGTESVAAAMRLALRDPQHPIRQMAFDWIQSSHDTNAAAELAPLYERETDLAMRIALVRALGAASNSGGKTIVRSILADPASPPSLLQAAIEAAGNQKDSECDAALLRLAEHPANERVLIQLAQVFGDRQMSEAVPLLGTLAEKPSAALAQAAVTALQNIGSLEAISRLTNLLESPVLSVRPKAINALGELKIRDAVPALLRAAETKETHEAAVSALVKIHDLRALDLYLEGLGAKDSNLRMRCVSTLRSLREKALPLLEAKATNAPFSPQTLAELRQVYQNDPTAKKSPIFRQKIKEISPEDYREFAEAHSGDARRGQHLFRDPQGVGCVRCHRLSGSGGQIGPDLTGIRTKYSHADIIESVLYPSKRILEGYQQIIFRLKSDDDVSGLVQSENGKQVTVIDSSGTTNVVQKTDILERKTSPVSLMPEGLQTGLSLNDFCDLIAYVESPEAGLSATARARHAMSPQHPPAPRPSPRNIASQGPPVPAEHAVAPSQDDPPPPPPAASDWTPLPPFPDDQ